MRTFLYMIVALGAVAGGFFWYLHAQHPAHVAGGSDHVEPLPIDPGAVSVGDIGPGDKPWIKKLDSESKLQYRFRTEEYTPRGGGRVDLKDVTAEFFQYVKDAKEGAENKTRVQQIRIVGKNGHIEVQEGPQASTNGFEKGTNGPPKRGLLNDVHIYVYPEWTQRIEAQIDDPKLSPAEKVGMMERLASTIATSPNIAFDNETFEVTTHEYSTPEGLVVLADQVPVHAIGDYEFDGKGLTMRWNDVEGHLEYLEIAHGNYLVVNDTSSLKSTGTSGSHPSTKPAAPIAWLGESFGESFGPPDPLRDGRGDPLEFAAKTKGLPPGAKPGATQPSKKKGPQPPYRAVFDQDVHISQGDRDIDETELAKADVMHVEFMSGSKATTRPSTRPAAKVGGKDMAVAGATNPATAAGASASAIAGGDVAPPTTLPTTVPSTQPAQQEPVIVRWTGKLRVTPMDAPGEMTAALKPGDSILRLFGNQAPVELNRDTSHVWCSSADYFSVDGSAQLHSSQQYGPVIVKQIPDPAAKASTQEATIVTQQLNYLGADKVAVLRGQSTAHIILPQQAATRPSTLPADAAAAEPATRPAQALDAKWMKEGRLHFRDSAGGGGAMAFDHAEFEGDVDVKHPQLALKSQRLELFFDEKLQPTTRPTTHPAGAPASQPAGGSNTQTLLKKMIATTEVWCDLTDSAGKKQTVTTDRLTMTTAEDAEGKLYPKIINADGQAHAYDGVQDLQAGHMELHLIPSTRPTTQPAQPAADAAPGGMDTSAVELQRMKAWDHVAVRNAEGSTAVGDKMDVNVVDGQPIARITGIDTAMATVTDPKGSRVIGPIIDFDPKRQWAKVTGKGSIRAIQGEPPQPPAAPPVAGRPPATQPAPKFIDIFWDRQAELDGAHNLITVVGPVLIKQIEPDGTVQRATGDRARIELAEKPATQPSISPTPPTVPAGSPVVASAAMQATRPSHSASRPSGGVPGVASGSMDLLKDKVVTAFELQQNAVVGSTLSDLNGILRQFEIKSQRVRYETGNATAAAAPTPTAAGAATPAPAAGPMAFSPNGNGRLIVPGAGTMLYRDHRPPTTQPTDPAAPTTSSSPEQARGATAFRWDKSMTYDQPSRHSTMLGNVLIVHQTDEPAAEPVHVHGDRVDALFESKPIDPSVQPKALTPPAINGDPTENSAMQLKWLTITGNMTMDRAGSTLMAQRADYNPATNWMTAVGTPQNPAVYNSITGSQVILSDQILWNTQTWMTRFVGFRGHGTSNEKPVPPKPVKPGRR